MYTNALSVLLFSGQSEFETGLFSDLLPVLAAYTSVRVWSNMDVILIECVVKGSHECGLIYVTAGETFLEEENR